MITFESANWVEQKIGQDGFLILDPRSSMQYLKGHIKGAISFPVKKLFDSNGKLLEVNQLEQVLGSVGLDNNTVPVLYDRYDGQSASILSWAMEYVGCNDLRIMDSFFEGWASQTRQIFYRPVPPVERKFVANIKAHIRVSMEDVVEDTESKLIDFRSYEEFAGNPELDSKPGHIPGAQNIEWNKLAGIDGQFLVSDDELVNIFNQVGLDKKDEIIAYCRSGRRASLGFVALNKLGYKVKLYDGSFLEWSTNDQPVDDTLA